jgi:hypothetical protein
MRRSDPVRGLPFEREHVDEVVRRVDGHRQLLADGDERRVVEEEPVLVDALGRDQREVEVGAPASARRMSAPTSSPAVVVVGPNSEFSVAMSSNARRSARRAARAAAA